MSCITTHGFLEILPKLWNSLQKSARNEQTSLKKQGLSPESKIIYLLCIYLQHIHFKTSFFFKPRNSYQGDEARHHIFSNVLLRYYHCAAEHIWWRAITSLFYIYKLTDDLINWKEKEATLPNRSHWSFKLLCMDAELGKTKPMLRSLLLHYYFYY